uniref:Uncharacterized protein n=1 Tax=Arundo donax TaxID=35708 RepID=A0A0A8Y5J7_ARUDO
MGKLEKVANGSWSLQIVVPTILFSVSCGVCTSINA